MAVVAVGSAIRVVGWRDVISWSFWVRSAVSRCSSWSLKKRSALVQRISCSSVDTAVRCVLMVNLREKRGSKWMGWN